MENLGKFQNVANLQQMKSSNYLKPYTNMKKPLMPILLQTI